AEPVGRSGGRKTAFPVAPSEPAGTADADGRGVPLASVWVLDAGSRFGIEALAPRAAAAELLRHAWTSRLVGAAGVPAAEAAAHLERCAAVAAAVPVSRLVVGPLAALPELATLVAQAVDLH
ncbi:MAG TPA: hypothetical protein VHQ65_12290, partial [Thermoanaerobaculia bacterium]|nr:hypothetical protein [Thermoanaerobaculia bacterium]